MITETLVNLEVVDKHFSKMPPKGQKARRGGKSPGLPKKQPKKVDEKSAAKEPPSELDESLRPEGVGSDVDYVIIYNMETEKFQYYPSRGYAGESLLSSSGIDVSQSLTKDDRMKEFKVKIAPTVSYKSRIFLRFEKGEWLYSWFTKGHVYD